MAEQNKFDVIVVGAGPGGAAASKLLAEQGYNVALIERAANPGEKNMSGSLLFRTPCDDIYDGQFSYAWEEWKQPWFTGLGIRWSTDNDELGAGVTLSFGSEPCQNCLLIFRPESDAWLFEQSVKAGAHAFTSTLVTDVIWENQGTPDARVVGVTTDKGDFYAPIVLDCSGLHSEIAKRVGLADWKSHREKLQVAMKFCFKCDDKEFLYNWARAYRAEDPVTGYKAAVYDWANFPVLAGGDPESWAAHGMIYPDRGMWVMTVYQCIPEAMSAGGVNIHQRMQWVLGQSPYKELVAKSEHVDTGFHGLGTFSTYGYIEKSYLPGLCIVGDAGGFLTPTDSWGANTAQWQACYLARELVPEMIKNNDYSEEMFKKYEDAWRASFIAEDELCAGMCIPFRDGALEVVMDSLVDFVKVMISQKWEGKSTGEIFLECLPSLGPILGVLPSLMNVLNPVIKPAVTRAGGLFAAFAPMLAQLQ